MIAALALALLAAEPRLEAAVFGARPTALSTGQLLGPSLRYEHVFEGAWTVGARARLGVVAEDDEASSVQHTELQLGLSAGRIFSLGRGELGASALVGGVLLRTDRTHHEADRLLVAGIPSEQGGWAFGPQLGLELGVRVFLVAGLGMSLSGGPSISIVPEESPRLGWSGALGFVWRPE